MSFLFREQRKLKFSPKIIMGSTLGKKIKKSRAGLSLLSLNVVPALISIEHIDSRIKKKIKFFGDQHLCDHGLCDRENNW